MLLGWEKVGYTFTKGNACPAFTQKGGGQAFLLFINCLQLKIILLPEWHVFGVVHCDPLQHFQQRNFLGEVWSQKPVVC